MKKFINKITNIINESQKPENKPLHTIIFELINFSTRLSFSPGEYFSYGFQAKNSCLKKVLEYLPGSLHFEKHLPTLNQKGRNILYDKLLFKNNFLNKNIPLVMTIGYSGSKKHDDVKFSYLTKNSIHSIFLEKNITDFIIKPANGNQGKGVFRVAYTPNTSTPFLINDRSMNTTDFFGFIADFSNRYNYDYFIFEELISIPDTLKNISPDAAPNIRIITLRTPDSNIHITHTSMRLGRKNSVTSNASSGGLLAKIDIETGIIVSCKTNICESGKFVRTHPDTNFEIIGFQIPLWNQVLEECKKAARLVDSVNSIGWDILITNHGPVILEGNDSWCIISEQTFGKGYLSPNTRKLLSQCGLEFPERVLPNPSLKNTWASLFGLTKSKKS